MIDCGFPVIVYSNNQSPLLRGQQHGEAWREPIHELVEIRKGLMRAKNPTLGDDDIQRLAEIQSQQTEHCFPELHQELVGICQGAKASMTDLIILNNYTDFRDIQIPDQGCSVVFTSYDGNAVAGQTWDMHESAKRYVCCIQVPCQDYDKPMVLFSLVGCLGMMGYHPSGRMVGVNNINTDKATAGVIWPALVRAMLAQKDEQAMQRQLTQVPVTSGHSYLLASPAGGQFWEVMPQLAEPLDRLDATENGYLFHTNHCLGRLASERETVIGQNSTTYIRYQLIEKKIPASRSFDDMYDLLNDHENYPKSICSNFQTNAQDPSVTCGGAVGDLNSGKIRMWRGDPMHDANFASHDFDVGGAADA